MHRHPAVPAAVASRRPRRGGFARVLLGVWSALYLLVAAAAPVADGFVDHSTEIVVHVEDADGGHCPASHGSEACDLCHLLQGARAVPPSAPSIASVVDRDPASAYATGDDVPAQLAFLAGHSSRAPPVLG